MADKLLIVSVAVHRLTIVLGQVPVFEISVQVIFGRGQPVVPGTAVAIPVTAGIGFSFEHPS